MSIDKISAIAERTDERNEIEELNDKVNAAMDALLSECIAENK